MKDEIRRTSESSWLLSDLALGLGRKQKIPLFCGCNLLDLSPFSFFFFLGILNRCIKMAIVHDIAEGKYHIWSFFPKYKVQFISLTEPLFSFKCLTRVGCITDVIEFVCEVYIFYGHGTKHCVKSWLHLVSISRIIHALLLPTKILQIEKASNSEWHLNSYCWRYNPIWWCA